MELELEIHEDCVNDAFFPYLFNTDRFQCYWGGRDSSKSDFVALKLLLACITQEYFLCILIRDVAETIKDSQYATLKKVADREGIDHLFKWGLSPLEITCKHNGNKFIARGCDDPLKLKSVSDPTSAWYEEANQISEESHNIISTTLRTSRNVPIYEIFTFNPDCEGDYKNFWIYKKFFERTGNENRLTFSGFIDVEVKEGEEIKQYQMPFSVLHTTYKDNRYVSIDRKVLYESYATTDAYKFKVWGLGVWATRQTGNEFYNKFKRELFVKHVPYLPGIPVHISLDFNVLPYMSAICAQLVQLDNNKVQLRIYKNYALRPPNNYTKAITTLFKEDHKNQRIAIYYYGDASGKNRIAGQGDRRAFDDFIDGMIGWLHNDSDKTLSRNVGIFKRRDFINAIFDGKYGIEIVIDESCAELIEDLEVVKTSVEGKLKKRVKDNVLGASYEEHGHQSDALDYLVTSIFNHMLTD